MQSRDYFVGRLYQDKGAGMVWQEILLGRISEDSTRAQIVLDTTGVLLTDQFTVYLHNRNVRFIVCNSINEVIRSDHESYSLILCPPLDIPVYLKRRYEIIHFSWDRLPVSFDPVIRQKITPADVVKLLNTASGSRDALYITQQNYKGKLKEADLHVSQLEKKHLEKYFQDVLKADLTSEAVLDLGNKWGEYLFLCFHIKSKPDKTVEKQLDSRISDFILRGGIKNAFYAAAKQHLTVDKILPFLSALRYEKMALVCFDGMGYAEWKILQRFLLGKGFQFKESFQFALIPTITSISRSAIFSGEYTSGFSKTQDDKRNFKRFWEDREKYTAFFREGELTGKVQLTGIDRVGLIYNFFDDIAHGMKFTAKSRSKDLYFDAIQKYLSEANIEKELSLLIDDGFKIYFCSDHGCVLSEGNGKKIDKYLIDKAGKRATIVKKSILNDFMKEQKYKIPFIDDKIAILANNRTIFSNRNSVELSHGGITLEELVVPLVEVSN